MMKISYYRKMLSTDDLVAAPIYFVFIVLLAFFIRGIILKSDDPIRKYFIPGLIVKLIGGIMVGIIYFFYYGTGDTVEYYNNSIVMYEAFGDSPYYFYRLLMAPPNYEDPTIMTYKWWMYFHKDDTAWFYGKLCGIVALFSFNIYMPMALWMAFISYSGVWALYSTLCKIYPEMYKKFALAVLFIPSVFFWGSGILKDSITLACVGWMTYSVYNVFFARRRVIANAILFILSTYLCLKLKPYIVFSMAPALVFWVFLYYRASFKSAFTRFLFGPLAVLAASVFGYIIITRLGMQYAAYSLSGVVEKAQVFQDWHGWLAENANASGYSLGEIDGSFRSIVMTIPAAINVTLFRPYLWQVRNPVMLLSALESTAVMIFTISIIWKTGIKHTILSLAKNPTAFFCIFYSIFFAFCVGFTAYNFGALVRYKIPCIPFFVAGVLILNMQTQVDKAARKQKHSAKPHRYTFDPV